MKLGLFRFVPIVALLFSGISIGGRGFAAEKTNPVATVSWSQLEKQGLLKSGKVTLTAGGKSEELVIANDGPGKKTLPLCELKAPAINSPSYAIRGKIHYENVAGVGFLEMWSHFPDGSKYFTRTMDTDGAMQMVTGTSLEREFQLPFHTFGKAPAPSKLEINLVLDGPGTVEIGPLELIGMEPFQVESSAAASGTAVWWSGSEAGLLGGIGGTILGLFGALLGTLVGTGRGKKLVLSLAILIAIAGAGGVLAGMIAVFAGQPYHVFYPLLFLGGMSVFAGIMALTIAPQRYRMHELRRMQRLDSM